MGLKIIKGEAADDMVKLAADSEFFDGPMMNGDLVGPGGEGFIVREALC